VGSITIDPALPFLDPLDCLAFVAGATHRINLGCAVLQLLSVTRATFLSSPTW
jgi:hypothetical protein